MFGSFLPGLGWLAPPKSIRAWEPTLLWNQLHSSSNQTDVNRIERSRNLSVKACFRQPAAATRGHGTTAFPEYCYDVRCRKQEVQHGDTCTGYFRTKYL